MTFGVTSAGFVKKKLTDIKTELEELLRARFGDINTNPDSVIGQKVGIYSEVAASIWDMAEAVYLSQYPNSAEGVSLDNVALITNVLRPQATPTLVNIALIGVPATLVPMGTQFRQPVIGEVFESAEDKTITDGDLVIVKVSNTGLPSITYTVIINGNSYQYTSPGATSKQQITMELANVINAGADSATVTAEPDPDDDEVLLITADNDDVSFSFQEADPNLEIDLRGTPVRSRALNTGPLNAESKTITEIVTPVAGLDEVTNIDDGVLGRNTETDEEFRITRKQLLQIAGAGTVPSIEARILQEVSGVTSISVTDNRTPATVDGIAPHGFRAVIQGGNDQDIWDKLWEVKPAGIETSGTEVGVVQDSQGNPQTVRFSRPTPQYVHLNIEFTLYSEEDFPTDGVDVIKNALLEYINGLGPGEDLIPQRYIPVIYGAVEGVQDITTLEHDVTPGELDPPSFVTTTIPIASDEVASADISRMTVVQV